MKGGRPTREQARDLDAISERVLVAHFDESRTTHEIARDFGISLRSVYRRVDRALKNRRRAARRKALEEREAE